MINEEETFRLFGHRSSDLSYGSEKKVIAVCDGCGKIRNLKFNSYHILCRSCANRSQQNKKSSRVRKICEQCEKIYFVKRSHRHRSRFCSTKCMAKWQSEKCKGENSPSWRGGRHEMVCKQCGDKYPVYMYQSIRSSFCSTKCAIKWRSENWKGKNNPNWKGGLSFGKYCEKFNFRFKEKIRNKYNRKCYMCDKNEELNGRRLDVHHVSYERECLCEGVECDFVPLCKRCHVKTNGNRFFWKALLTYALQYEDEYCSDITHNPLILLAL